MVQPIRNQILLKPFMGDEFTAGGIVVPDLFRKESDKCEVIAVGNGTKSHPMRLKAGDVVFRVAQWGEPIVENGTMYYLVDHVRDNAILAKQ